MNGYTEVWSGSADQLLAVAQQWLTLVDSSSLKTETVEGNWMKLSAPNEFIDWAHFRKSGEYLPLGAKTIRAIKRAVPLPYDVNDDLRG